MGALAFARKRDNYRDQAEMVAGTVRGTGRFTTAGTGAPTVFSTGPWTIARTGVGTYTVTGTEQFIESIGADASLHQATGGTGLAFVVLGSPTPGASPKTPWSFTIETQSAAGTKADLTGPVVVFDMCFRSAALKK